MYSYMGLNRRKDGERRVWNVGSASDYRGEDRRDNGSNSYFLVLGNGGIDGVSVACLIALALIVMIVVW